MTSLSEAEALVKASPYNVLESWEKDGHFYFKLGLKVRTWTTPYIFAVPANLKTAGDMASAIAEQLQIVAAEHKVYIENGVGQAGMPTWG